MRIIILGAGAVGYYAAKQLIHEGNEVAIVDQDPDVIDRVTHTLDAQPILGKATSPDVLHRAGAHNADLLIAATGSDEVNILACEIVHKLFHTPQKIARIRDNTYMNPDWADLFGPSGILIDSIISPEVEIGQTIARSIRLSHTFDIFALCHGQIKVAGVRLPKQARILNTPLRFLPAILGATPIVICAIHRGAGTILPDGDSVLLPDDEVYFAVPSDQIDNVMDAMGFPPQRLKRVLIVGGGKIGSTLALELENTPNISVNIKLIERDQKQANMLGHMLRKTQVICGDGLDMDLMQQCNLGQVDGFIALTQDDRVNLMSAMLAKKLGARRTLSLVNTPAYGPHFSTLGVDAVIVPRQVTVSTILQHIRQGRIRSIHALYENYAQVIEVDVFESASVVGSAVSEVSLHHSIVVVAILRLGHVMMYPENEIINVGDRLVMVVRSDMIAHVEQIFKAKERYY